MSIKEYQIDLREPEESRWSHVISAEKKLLPKIVNSLGEVSVSSLTGLALGAAYRVSNGLWGDEIASWADGFDITKGQCVALQCSYELAQTLEYTWSVFGCTAAVIDHDDLGPVHVRTMDWDLSMIGKATRIFRFVEGKRSFVTVGVLGYVGVLSGMVPGQYSVTLNYAPPLERPGFGFGPAFLIRHVLETCDTFAEAVKMLSETPLMVPAFFTVCGTKKGQACVIESKRNEYRVRPLKGRSIVQTNHHVVKEWQDDVYDDEVLEFSTARYEAMQRSIDKANPKSLKGYHILTKRYPVYNETTGQRMTFHPRSGDIIVDV